MLTICSLFIYNVDVKESNCVRILINLAHFVQRVLKVLTAEEF